MSGKKAKDGVLLAVAGGIDVISQTVEKGYSIKVGT